MGRKKAFGSFAPLLVFWLLSRYKPYEDIEEDVVRLKSRVLETFFEWVKVLESCIGLPLMTFGQLLFGS